MEQKKSKVIIISIVVALILIVGTVATVSVVSRSSNEPTKVASQKLSLGQKFLLDLDYEKAVAEFNAVIEIEPRNVDAYIGLADAYIGLGDEEKAIEALEKGYEATGDEIIKAKLDELKKPEETTVETIATEVTTTADETTTSEVTTTAEVTTNDKDNTTIKEKENISIIIEDSKNATIKLKNLEIRDSYIVNRDTSEKDVAEYLWEVRMIGCRDILSVGTHAWAFSPGRNEEKQLEDMQSSLWQIYDSGRGVFVKGVNITYDSESITWNVSVPEECEFDFNEITECEITIDGVDMAYESYKVYL
ncbi:MAG: tetratricopeptide repeat protein [Oscillospiraceae bacterium]